MQRRFIIYAVSASPAGTMGGNTKIAIEIARNLPVHGWKVVVIVPTSKKATFLDNLPAAEGVEYVEIEDFPVSELRHLFGSARHFSCEVSRTFERLDVGPRDVVYATCNFHTDILPLRREKRKRRFVYLATHYLFVPFIVENLVRHYRFPAIKYLAAWFYERMLFSVNRSLADGFVITNDDDRRHFGAGWQKRMFAFYGGVNVEQIPRGASEKTRDVVFCSRLHPQKGVEGLLDIWRFVREKNPLLRLTLIGNGAPDYEARLRRKVERLGIADSIDWLGYVNNEAKFRVYSESRVFVHPTVFDNNGMVAAEALCSGLPVVMYDLPALRKVYADGCVKVPYGDKVRFADEIVRLASDAAHYAEVAPTAEQVKTLREHWNWPSRVDRFVEFLTGLEGERERT